MTKIRVTFDCEDDLSLRRIADYDRAHNALWDIAQDVFRPARKHGYEDKSIQDLIDKLDPKPVPGNEAEPEPGATELISMLEQKFYEIINGYSLQIDQ